MLLRTILFNRNRLLLVQATKVLTYNFPSLHSTLNPNTLTPNPNPKNLEGTNRPDLYKDSERYNELVNRLVTQQKELTILQERQAELKKTVGPEIAKVAKKVSNQAGRQQNKVGKGADKGATTLQELQAKLRRLSEESVQVSNDLDALQASIDESSKDRIAVERAISKSLNMVSSIDKVP